MNTNASASMSVKEMNALRKEITQRNASQAFAQYNNSSDNAPAHKRNTKLGSRDAALEPIRAKSRTQTLERPGYANDGFGEYGNKNDRNGNNSSTSSSSSTPTTITRGLMDEHKRPLYQGLDFLREIQAKFQTCSHRVSSQHERLKSASWKRQYELVGLPRRPRKSTKHKRR